MKFEEAISTVYHKKLPVRCPDTDYVIFGIRYNHICGNIVVHLKYVIPSRKSDDFLYADNYEDLRRQLDADINVYWEVAIPLNVRSYSGNHPEWDEYRKTKSF